MKARLILFLAILFYACGSDTTQKVVDKEVIIDISYEHDYLKMKFKIHKDREVRIYSSSSRMPGSELPNYALYIYRKGVGQTGNFIFWGHYKYDKAAYKWANDSTLNFRLFNSSNNFSDNYTYKILKDGENLAINMD